MDDWDPKDLTAQQREEFVTYYRNHMIYGVLWAGGGTIVTVISLQTGGIIAYGAIIYGIFDFFKGLSGWLKYKL